MKYIYPLIFLILFKTTLSAQTSSLIETSDIPLFWHVYDKVILMKDSVEAVRLIQEEYINKGSAGLSSIRNFNVFESKDLYHTIKTQQVYLNSIRQATIDIKNQYAGYEAIFDNFKKIYPLYSYPKVFCTIGNMLIGGFNSDDSNVIVGVELAAGTKSAKTEALNDYLKVFTQGNPGIRYLLTHEIVHTQQTHGYQQNMNLTGICIMEGSADFIADLLLKRKNSMPYSLYGRKYNNVIKRSFIKDKLESDQSIFNKWIYNTALYVSGEMTTRPDLGYYIGYKICESYYNKAKNKNQAITDILQINYDDKRSVMRFYDTSGYE
jgi:hypothetical protein